MRSVAPMRTAKIGYIIISAVLCGLGITLIVVPEFSAAVLGKIFGALLIVFGAVRLVGFFSKDLYRLAFQYDFAFGMMMIALGILLLLRPGSFMDFLCITLGLSFLMDGLFKIQIAIDSKRFGIRRWWLILSVAILSSICAGLLIFRPGDSRNILTILLGIALLGEGLLNLATVVTAVKIIRHQQPDIVEVDFYEEREV